jgi:hypothetical protein
MPAFTSTGMILLQTTPGHLRAALNKCARETLTVDGILEITEEHFWTQAPGAVVGSLIVRVRSDAKESEVLGRVRGIYARLVADLTVQVEKDPPLNWLVGGGGGSGAAGGGAGDAGAGGGFSTASTGGHSSLSMLGAADGRRDGHGAHHGHSHGGHGGDEHHGHAHGGHGGDDHHGHAHGGHGDDDHHGHAHGGHGDHHGHSHGGGSTSRDAWLHR